jgi:hypothetical protein
MTYDRIPLIARPTSVPRQRNREGYEPQPREWIAAQIVRYACAVERALERGMPEVPHVTHGEPRLVHRRDTFARLGREHLDARTAFDQRSSKPENEAPRGVSWSSRKARSQQPDAHRRSRLAGRKAWFTQLTQRQKL